MKLLLIIVSVITVLTVDGWDFPGEYGGVDSEPGETESHNSVEADPETTFSIEGPTSENEVHQLFSNQTSHIISRKSESGCKALDICIIMGGSCVTNATICGGRLVPGCKGKNCQCCVPGTLETKINSLEEKLQTMQINSLEQKLKNMQANLTNTNSKLNMVLQTLKNIITNSNSNLNDEFQTLKDNITEANSNLNVEFQALKDNITDTNSNLDEEFQALKDNITVANSNVKVEFQTLKENITDVNSYLSVEFKNLKDNITNANSNMESKLDVLLTRCPLGFFQAAGSSQCYKLYNDKKRTWTQAKEKCLLEGLVLAEPTNPLSLRKYMVETYVNTGGDVYSHIGARGTGSYFRFERSGRQISKTNSLWYSGHPSSHLSTSYCICLLVQKSHFLHNNPNQPYYVNNINTMRFTLCEH